MVMREQSLPGYLGSRQALLGTIHRVSVPMKAPSHFLPERRADYRDVLGQGGFGCYGTWLLWALESP